jgi:hypothetical protein
MCLPVPTPLSSLAALFPCYAQDSFPLTKPNTSCTSEVPASLRSDGVRVYPGMPSGFPSESAFGFARILFLGIAVCDSANGNADIHAGRVNRGHHHTASPDDDVARH